MEPVELIIAVYNVQGMAEQVLKDLQAQEKQKTIRMVDSAVLVKDKGGKTTLKETQDVDAKRGALFGAVTGALVGLLGGPLGVVVGAAAGAATGGVTAGKIDLGFSNGFLNELKGSLRPESSLLLVIVEQTWAEKVYSEMKLAPGRIFRHAVREEIIKQMADNQNLCE